ncbi:unnamed protein product [Mytilus coruscus]|uniref:Uncharacterized protein n=1 Tax=Mytilus coruscus TaxID=42192 RepID=A0A6J8EUI4_MYTCO|nr:unnamed protein product [Mytilus coruscus]
MSFQPEKKKSLSDRFGCIPSVGHGQQNESQNFSKSWKSSSSGQKNTSFTNSYSRNEKKDPKNTLTVCLKVNRQNRDNSYVNRPCQPLRMECRDKPSEITKQFSRNGSQDSKENNSVNFNHGYGRQVSVKDTCVNGELRNSHDQSLRQEIGITSQTLPLNRIEYNHSLREASSLLKTPPKFSGNNLIFDNHCEQLDWTRASPQFVGNYSKGSAFQNERYNQLEQEGITKIDRNAPMTNSFRQGGYCNQFPGQVATVPPSSMNRKSPYLEKCNSTVNNKDTDRAFFNTSPQFSGNFNSTRQTAPDETLLQNSHTGSRFNSSPGFIQNTQSQMSNQGYAQHQPQHAQSQTSNQGYAQQQPQHTQSQTSNQGYAQQQSQHTQSQMSNQGYAQQQPQLFINNIRDPRSPGFIQNDLCNARSFQNAHENHGFYGNELPPSCLSQNKSPVDRNKNFKDNCNFNMHNQNAGSQHGPYGLINIVTPEKPPFQVNKVPIGSKQHAFIHQGKQQMTPAVCENRSNNGHNSPMFSSDSEMSLDTNVVCESSSQDLKEKIKPTGFYNDVEELTKKFFGKCEKLTKTSEDKKTLEKINTQLHTEIITALNNCNQNTISPDASERAEEIDQTENKTYQQDGMSPKLVIDESRKEGGISQQERNISEDIPSDEMKFEGRTLLKGGVKPRHVPKMLIDKPGQGPPNDRRTVYMTCRNLLELPLPNWAAEALGKHVLEHDITNGHNKESKPFKTSSCKAKKEPVETNKLEKRLTEIFNVKDGKKKGIETKVNQKFENIKLNSQDQKKLSHTRKITDSKDVKKPSSEQTKKIQPPKDSKRPVSNENCKSNKKVKTSDKVNLTLGEALLAKQKEINPVKQKQVEKEPVNISTASSYASKNGSRDNSRSRIPRSRESSRSRNRSRSRDRHSWKTNKYSDSQYKRTEQNSYRSRSRDVRNRSPVSSGGKSNTKHGIDRAVENVTATIKSIIGKDFNWPYNESDDKSFDMYDFRGSDDIGS